MTFIQNISSSPSGGSNGIGQEIGVVPTPEKQKKNATIRNIFFFIKMAFLYATIAIFFGYASFLGCNDTPSETFAFPISFEDKDDMSALDRRMLKYFKSYNYVPPVSEVYSDVYPAKECGLSPNFDAFFELGSNQRSAKGEDKWIYENLFKGKTATTVGDVPPAGTFVEIGAYNGMQESNSRFFEACLGWKGLLIEGQPGNYRGVLRDRPHAHKMSFAPSCDAEFERVNKTIPFSRYPMTNAGLKGHAKAYDSKPHIDVPCGPFSPVLEDIFAMSNGRIDFFSLDVEGSENLVLQTIDFTKVMIDVILIEVKNQHCRGYCEVREQVRDRMSSERYIRYENLIHKSDLYVHPNSTYQLADTFKAASS